MMPYSRNQWSEGTGSDDIGYVVFEGTAHSQRQTSFIMEASGTDAVKRLLSCVLVNLIPEDGLDETLASLKNLLDYYSVESYLALPSPIYAPPGEGELISPTERPHLVIE